MAQTWDYKNQSISLETGVNPIADPLEYMRMINSPKNAYELEVARHDSKSTIAKKEMEFLQTAEEINIAIILMHICEYAAQQRAEASDKEALLQDWRARQAAEEELRRQFDKPSDSGSVKYFDHSFRDMAENAKLATKLYDVVLQIEKSQVRIENIQHQIEKVNASTAVINQDWRTAKVSELEAHIAELKQQHYVLQVMVRDGNGKATKQKDSQGVEQFVFRSVTPDSEEGKRLLDVFHVLPKTSSDPKVEAKPKDEYAISRRLQALLLSYDVELPKPLERNELHQLQAPIPAPPKPPKKPVQKAALDFDQFFKREQLDEAFQGLFVKTRGGVNKEDLVNITADEMLALLRAEYAKNKFKINLQHKPSPATMKALTEAVQNALLKSELNSELMLEQESFNKQMKSAAAMAHEFSARHMGNIDIMKVLNGTELEKTHVLQQILAAKHGAEPIHQNRNEM